MFAMWKCINIIGQKGRKKNFMCKTYRCLQIKDKRILSEIFCDKATKVPIYSCILYADDISYA